MTTDCANACMNLRLLQPLKVLLLHKVPLYWPSGPSYAIAVEVDRDVDAIAKGAIFIDVDKCLSNIGAARFKVVDVAHFVDGIDNVVAISGQ